MLGKNTRVLFVFKWSADVEAEEIVGISCRWRNINSLRCVPTSLYIGV